jgi:hypothetical protein
MEISSDLMKDVKDAQFIGKKGLPCHPNMFGYVVEDVTTIGPDNSDDALTFQILIVILPVEVTLI